MQLIRGTITTIDKLDFGDRFVFAKDKLQRKYTKVHHEARRTQWRTYVYWALEDGKKHPVSLSNTTLLKFLRRPEDEAI
jgi:hypothetical protein